MSIGEKLKQKIDEIALGLIDETRKYEAMYLFEQSQSKKHFEPSSFDDTK